MSGNSRTGRRDSPINPKSTSTKFIIQARMGRWMEMRGRIIEETIEPVRAQKLNGEMNSKGGPPIDTKGDTRTYHLRQNF
jgi:hypothetical protein